MSERSLQDLSKARAILRNLGVRAAAGFMRNRGWGLEAALWWLLGASPRPSR